MRRLYAERRQAFYDTCNRELGDLMRLLPSEAGIQLVARLNDDLDDRAVARAAAAQGVNVSPFSRYFRAGRELHGLILGYAACDAPQTARGISTLRRVFAECQV